MQEYDNKEIAAKARGMRPIAAVMHGLKVVWMAVRSCFGSGVWVENKPWLDNEKWKS